MNNPETHQRTSRRHAVRVRVNDEELAYLQQLAERDDRSISSVLRVALKELVERERAQDGVTA